MAGSSLQSCSPEILSLILCQDPILKRIDLNFICFISHAFRNEGENFRTVFHVFEAPATSKTGVPLSEENLHHATNVTGLVLLFPPPFALDFANEDIARLASIMNMCVNLKEMVVVPDERHGAKIQEPSICVLSRRLISCCRLLSMGSS